MRARHKRRGRDPATPSALSSMMTLRTGQVKQRGRRVGSGPGRLRGHSATGEVTMSSTSQSSPTFSIVTVTWSL